MSLCRSYQVGLGRWGCCTFVLSYGRTGTVYLDQCEYLQGTEVPDPSQAVFARGEPQPVELRQTIVFAPGELE